VELGNQWFPGKFYGKDMDFMMKKLTGSLKVNFLFAVIIVSLFAAIVLINGITLRLSERFNLHFDLTAGALYEIGSDTKALLASLDTPVSIYVLSDERVFSGDRYLTQVKRIIDQFPHFSGNISLEYIDYASNPTFAVNYPDFSLSQGDLIVQSGDRVRHLPGVNLFYFTAMPDGRLAIVSSRAEEALTSAIASIIGGESVKIALLTGNGTSGGSLFASLLVDNNYEVHTVGLTTPISNEYDAAMLFSPTIDLSEDVIRNLEGFLYNGGQYGKLLFYTAGATQGTLPNLEMFLSEWGISPSDGAVFETTPERTYQFQPFYPTVEYEPGKFTDMLRDPFMPFLMPLAKPVELLFSARDGYFVETLLFFSETSGVRPSQAGDDFNADQTTRRGPMPALVTSGYFARSSGDAELHSTIVVSSSTAMLDSIALQNSSLNNAEYLLNLFSELLGREDIINIQPKSLAGRTLGITSAEASTLGVILVGIIPLAILLAGLTVWLVRRFK